MLPSADYSHIESTRKMLKDQEHVKSCFPAFISTCLRGRLWECEVEDPYSEQPLPAVSFHDFVHGAGERGLGSSYEEIERILRERNDQELVALWEEASGRRVHPGREHISLTSIRRDGGTQSRARLDDATVTEYAERLAELPPVTVYHDGEAYWLADGFHRVAAHERAGAAEVLCDVRQGSRRDAVLHSVGANAKHGLPRSNKDKRRAVEMLLTDEEWMQRGDDWIAEKCAVTDKTVTKARHDLEATSEIPKLTYRIGRDGKKRNLPSPPAPPPKTRADKRAAVEKSLRDPELRDLSNRQIAERCGVTDKTVAAVRAELSDAKLRTSDAKLRTHQQPETQTAAGRTFASEAEAEPSSAGSAHSAHPSHESSEHPPHHGGVVHDARGPNLLGSDPDGEGEVCQGADPRQVDMFEPKPAPEPAAPPAQLPGLSAEAREVRIRLRALPMDQRRAIHALEREELCGD